MYPSQRAAKRLAITFDLTLRGMHRMIRTSKLALLALMITSVGCQLARDDTTAESASFRVRADFAASLNADRGWAAGIGEEATVYADRPFRIRFRVHGETPLYTPPNFGLEYRRNGGAWRLVDAHDFPYPNREANFSFATGRSTPDAPLDGWQVTPSTRIGLRVVDDGRYALETGAGESAIRARFSPGWPVTEFSTRLQILDPEGEGVDLWLTGRDNQDRFHISLRPNGRVRLKMFQEGRIRVQTEQNIGTDTRGWTDVSVQRDGNNFTVELNDDTMKWEPDVPALSSFNEVGFEVPGNERVRFEKLDIGGESATPEVSIVRCPPCEEAMDSTALLGRGTTSVVHAPVISLSERVTLPNVTGDRWITELEWPLVIRRFSDGPTTTEDGDRFEFRVVADGTHGHLSPVAGTRLSVPPGRVGGTFVETPGRIGPWQASNGDLYFIMEPTETDNIFMMVRSVDGGQTWSESNGDGRPKTDDLEAVDSRLVDDTIHIVHQVTDRVVYHAFYTSDHPDAPNTWGITDELVGEVRAAAQMAAMEVRSDGSIVAAFLGQNRLYLSERPRDGRWSPQRPIDAEAPASHTGPQMVVDIHDIVHLAYGSTDGRVWYRRLTAEGELTTAMLVAQGTGTARRDWGAVLPLVYLPRRGVVAITYRLADGTLWQRRVNERGQLDTAALLVSTPVVTDAVDSQQVVADIIGTHDDTALLFVLEATGSIMGLLPSDRATPPRSVITNIKGSWVRGNRIEGPDGVPVYGFVYDAGSLGGTGMNRYFEVHLTP